MTDYHPDVLPPELEYDEQAAEIFDSLDDEQAATWLDDEQKAEWLLRRVVRAQVRTIEATLLRDAWVAKIDAWYDEQTAGDRAEVERLTAALERYAVMRRDRDNRATVHLPSGTLRTRRESYAHIDIADEKAVLAWALANPDLGLIHPKPVLVSELREVVTIRRTEDGDGYVVPVDNPDTELVPGVVIVEPSTTASVSPRH